MSKLVLTAPLVSVPIILVVVVIVEEPLSLTHQVILLLRIRRRAESDDWAGRQETRRDGRNKIINSFIL
jgi:hypothetical protein